MEETRDDPGPTERGSQNTAYWPSDIVRKFGSVSLDCKDDVLNARGTNTYENTTPLSSQRASQVFWRTGLLSEKIPNGFYSVIPDSKIKEIFDDVPTLDELSYLCLEGFKPDVILVDAVKDKKLSKLKQLIVALVRGLSLNPAAMVKKIAGLVCDFYKRPNLELSPAKALHEETSNVSENQTVQMLGQIKLGSCRPRAILFKVLADAVGLECSLVVGLSTEVDVECLDSYNHMSVVVVMNSVELLVDLMRFPGQLVPRSTKAIIMTHMPAAGESDSAENDSCDSPMEANSPLYGFADKVDSESAEKDGILLYPRRLESSSNVAGRPVRSVLMRSSTSIDRKLSISHSEPNIAATFWRRSRRRAIAEQRTASSSPEHPSFRGRGRSMLSGDRKSFGVFADDIATSRSEGASTSEPRRLRRRSISITPEIGDDIVRAVRAMSETLKQNRLLREQGDDKSIGADQQKEVSNFGQHNHDKPSLRRTASYAYSTESSHKAISLPTSPHEYQRQESQNIGNLNHNTSDETVSTWNRILELPSFQDKPLLPFQEWNIDYEELTVGTRVGIGFFGEVFRGIWNGTDVAIKVFLEQDLTAENMEDFCNEISILSRLRHPNVILFLGACTKPPHLSMVTEYMDMGSLYYLIHLTEQKKKLSWRRRLKMVRDICRGLMCLHRMKIIHRDLKSANCLVNKHWTVKLCDFGLSRITTEMPMRDTFSAGTPEWMAPELIRNEPFTEKCDIFSLGVVMWELCTLSRPWDGVPPERVVYTVANEGSRLEIPEGPLASLIADCWAEPDQRPCCEEILTRLLECEYSLC